ncbi:MAG: cytoplasmic protein [Acidobacteria bacterium]|nr:cytoplasmic protein [Acidobacteriota bacterium]
MRLLHRVMAATLFLAIPLAGALLAGADPSPGKPPLQSERVLLENDKVRVLEYVSKPSGGVCGVDRHSHPAHVTIVLEAARDRMTPEGGKPEVADLKAGDVFWSEAETHTDVNIGKSDSRLIVVEIK